mgnify:CR=1 FL=1
MVISSLISENTSFTLDDSPLDAALIEVVEYYKDGSIYQKGKIRNGKLHGHWIMFDRNGNIICEMLYNNGNKKKLTKYRGNDRIIINYVDNKPFKYTQIAFLK